MVVLGILTAGIAQVFTGVGQWLVVSDPLIKSRAIVVLGGHLPFRAMEAASIYRQGWAPEVWLTAPEQPAEDEALKRLGVHVVPEQVYGAEVLEKLGVPAGSIRTLESRAQNTYEEVGIISRELKRAGGGRVILVTSLFHGRRVRATWRAVVGDGQAVIVRSAILESSDPGRWWRRPADVAAVSREVFGLLNVWLGFPLKPDRP